MSSKPRSASSSAAAARKSGLSSTIRIRLLTSGILVGVRLRGNRVNPTIRSRYGRPPRWQPRGQQPTLVRPTELGGGGASG
jgi:hypothetical protein